MVLRIFNLSNFALLLVSIQESDMFSSQTNNFINSLKTEVKHKTNWIVSDIVVVKSPVNLESGYNTKFEMLLQCVLQSKPTKLLLNTTGIVHLKFRKYLSTFRLKDPCCIVIHEDTKSIQLRGIFLDKILPGGVSRSFHIFPKKAGTNLLTLEIKYFSPMDFDELSTESYPTGGLFDTLPPNWQKEPLKMTVTGMLIHPNVNLFRTRGKWDLACFGHTHYAAEALNATPTFVGISKPATRKSSEINDGLDDYVNPLLSGEMHTTCKIFDPSMIHYGLVFLSKTTEYDKITFVTRTPETVKIQSLFKSLTFPFDSTLWSATGISILGVTFIVFMTMNVFDTKTPISLRSLLHNFGKITISMLRTALDQPGFELDVSSHVKLHSYSWLILLLWESSASLILCNMYKSVLISALVKPDFMFVPKTFQQLVESSWNINAMLYNDSLRILFAQINDSITRVLLERAKGVAFIQGTTKCMIDVVESNSVCMGHASPVNLFSTMELTDSQGKGIYRVSDDGIFSSFGAMGVSRKHPHVLGALLRIQSAMETSGIALHWRAVGYAQTKKRARNNSLIKNGTSIADRFFSRTTKDLNDKNWNLLSNLLEVEFIGLGISLGMFFVELLLQCCRMICDTT